MDAVSILIIMLTGLWVFIPAMIPNSAAAVFGGGPTIDGGRKWKGSRIFGNGKTWRGFFGGALVGIIVGVLMIDLAYFFDSVDYWGFGPFWSNVGVVICLSFGAVLGDLMGAFIKRRLGLKKGRKSTYIGSI